MRPGFDRPPGGILAKFFSATDLPKIRMVFSRYVWPRRRLLLLGFVFMILFALLEAASVKILEPIFDEVFIDKNRAVLKVLALQVVLLFAFKGLASYLQSVCLAKVGLGMIKGMQDDLFNRLIRQDVAFFYRHNSSGLLVHFIGDMQMIKDAVLNGFTALIKDGFTVIFLVGLMFWKSLEMAAVMFILFPAGVYPAVYFGRKAKRLFTSQQITGGNLFALITQCFQGIKIVKAYQTEDQEIGRVKKSSGELADLALKIARTSYIASPLMELLGGVALAATLSYGGWRITQGQLTTGAFMVFLLAIVAAYKPMKNLANLNIRVQIGVAAIDRVFNLMNQAAAIGDAPEARELAVSGGAVEFQNVTFGYDPNNPVLQEVSLSLAAGRTAGVVGLAGAGKSTLVNLLERFYDVQAGAVLIDGQDVRSVTLKSLRRNLAFVSQEVVLFEGTIFDNIQLGRPEAAAEEVLAAAQRCGAHDFIIRQPEGYQTQVGERGGQLSGGQKQLISIARALLKDAPILLLDEPTSSLDANSEQMVLGGLRELMKDRTTLIIAHRLSTIREVHAIYVLEEGRVIESGPHQALMNLNGRYAHLYKLQHPAGDGS